MRTDLSESELNRNLAPLLTEERKLATAPSPAPNPAMPTLATPVLSASSADAHQAHALRQSHQALAADDTASTLENFQNEVSSEPRWRSSAALQLAPGVTLKSGSWLEQQLQQMPASPQSDRFEPLVQHLKDSQQTSLSESITDLEFDSPRAKLNFLSRLAAAEPEAFATHFPSFGITDLEEKIQLALACGCDALIHFENLAIDPDDALVFIEAMSTDSRIVPGVAALMSEVLVANPDDRLRIAKLCMQANPYYTGAFIQNFKLADERERCYLALQYFQCIDSAMTDKLVDFEITQPAFLRQSIIAATRCVHCYRDMMDLFDLILDAPIDSEKIDLAIHLLLRVDESSQDFEIDMAVDKLRKLSTGLPLSEAAQFFFATELFGREFDKTAEGKSWEKLCAIPLPSSPEFATLAQATRQKFPNLASASNTEVSNFLLDRARQDGRSEARKITLLRLKGQLDSSPHPITTMFGIHWNMLTDQAGMPQFSKLKWARNMWLMLMLSHKHQGDALLKIAAALPAIFQYPDQRFRMALMDFITEASGHNLEQYHPARFAARKALPALAFIKFPLPGLMQQVLDVSEKAFDNGFRLKSWLNTIMALSAAWQSPKLVADVLTVIFPDSALQPKSNTHSKKNIDKTQLFKNLLNYTDQARILIELDSQAAQAVAAHAKSLPQAFKEIVLHYFQLNASQYLSFEKIFLSYREPMTVLTYLKAVRSHPIAMLALRSCIQQIILGKFPASRYSQDPVLGQRLPGSLEAWRSNIEMSADALGGPPGYKLVFTDAHEDFFRMGSDVPGSCQRVDGETHLNRGLIGAIWDGKHKLCALKQASGQIAARSLVQRMSLSKPGTEAPLQECLMVERIYPPNASALQRKLLLQFALQQAARLQLPLAVCSDVVVADDVAITRPCTQTLYSGALAYPVYCDALSGMQDEAFSIPPDGDKPLSWVSPLAQT
jgi:hypothetical protein